MNTLELNQSLHGFVVEEITPIEELSANAVMMRHEKTNLKLLFLNRKDENKTFAITFKTIPSDSTGVFHILEHSVLCGSDKFPLKEPFVDLLKSSMQTFLNAMTFPDKTMYPVSSRNDKDLHNLMDVYLDAVFNPLARHKKEIFMQEGWHIEEDENGTWQLNGVVYNEMRGVFSSVDSLMTYKLLSSIFRDTCYGFESGGNPKDIPSLSYRQFVETYHKFYHPSNATVFLDGNVDLDDTLSLIDSYLQPFDKKQIDFEIAYQKPQTVRMDCEYEADSEESLQKVEIAKAFYVGTYAERKRALAVSILGDILCGSNDSPLKRELLSKGLCEDVYISGSDETQQKAIFIIMRGVPKDRADEAEMTLSNVIAKLAENGIDKKQLHADVNLMEFAANEADFGSYPAGLVYCMRAQETWLYGGNPVDALRYSELYQSLRDEIETDYYENLLSEVFVNSHFNSTVIMVPSLYVGRDDAAKLEMRLERMRKRMSQKDKEELEEDNRKLEIFRNSADSPELSALVPHLELSDIERKIKPNSCKVDEIDGVKVISSNLPVEKIEYIDLYFDLSSFSERELWAAGMLTSVVMQSKSENHSALDMSTLLKTYLGSFDLSALFTPQIGQHDATAYLNVAVGALKINEDKIFPLFEERMLKTVFESDRISEVLKQSKLSYELSLKENGHRHAAMQVKSTLSQSGAIAEILSGQRNYDYIVGALENVDEFAEFLASTLKKILNRNRLTISTVGSVSKTALESLINVLPSFEADLTHIEYEKGSSDNISIASDVSYCAKAVDIAEFSPAENGAFAVATNLLSLEYLWNEVRVKGGAYGCSCTAGTAGELVFSSFRDPNPANSENVYDNAAKALVRLAKNEEDLSKFIIGAISHSEPITTPYSSGKKDTLRVLSGISDDMRLHRRLSMLDCRVEDLIEISKAFEKLKNGPCCIVSGRGEE